MRQSPARCVLANVLVGSFVLLGMVPCRATDAGNDGKGSGAASPLETELLKHGLKRSGLHFALVDEESEVLKQFPITRQNVAKLLQAQARVVAMMEAQAALAQQQRLVQALGAEAAQARAASGRMPSYGRYGRMARSMHTPAQQQLQAIQANQQAASAQEKILKASQPTAQQQTAASNDLKAAETLARTSVDTLRAMYETAQSHYKALDDDTEAHKLVETYARDKGAAVRIGPSKAFEDVGHFLAKLGPARHTAHKLAGKSDAMAKKKQGDGVKTFGLIP